MNQKPLQVWVAGSTIHTLECAAALAGDPRFQITHILTPSPKPQGRRKELTPNPLQQWGETNGIALTLIETKIDAVIKEALNSLERPDILLVVDFGFIVPQWLLDIPKIAPVNIHPSALPRYRGSSPGQFVLSLGEMTSAVTLMVMDAKLDHGPVITQIEFNLDPNWTARAYYAHAFMLIGQQLPSLLSEFVTNPASVSPQPDTSPTPVARMLKREDGYVPLETLKALLSGEAPMQPIPFLEMYAQATQSQTLFNLWRGFHPWPGLWTTVKTTEGEKRLKLLEFTFSEKQLNLHQIQWEGKNPQPFDPKMIQ